MDIFVSRFFYRRSSPALLPFKWNKNGTHHAPMWTHIASAISALFSPQGLPSTTLKTVLTSWHRLEDIHMHFWIENICAVEGSLGSQGTQHNSLSGSDPPVAAKTCQQFVLLFSLYFNATWTTSTLGVLMSFFWEDNSDCLIYNELFFWINSF